MPEPVDLSLLRSFVAVKESKSLQLAAARVGRSQSAVSMQIKRLEADIGRPLFLREGRSLRANPAGEELLIHARRLLRLSDEMMASLRAPEAAGAVRLGLPEDYAAYLLAPVLARFAREFPLAEISLTFDNSPGLLRHLAAGQLDLALVTREPDQPFSVLRQERFVWAAAPEHTAWLRDPMPVALFEAGDIARRFALEALQAMGKPYRVVSSTHSLLGLITVAQAGLAVVGLAESSVPHGLAVIGKNEGLPDLPVFDLCLVPAPGEPARLTGHLAVILRRELAQQGERPRVPDLSAQP
jgi:DNA-binding transcriptional LysR family regulator